MNDHYAISTFASRVNLGFDFGKLCSGINDLWIKSNEWNTILIYIHAECPEALALRGWIWNFDASKNESHRQTAKWKRGIAGHSWVPEPIACLRCVPLFSSTNKYLLYTLLWPEAVRVPASNTEQLFYGMCQRYVRAPPKIWLSKIEASGCSPYVYVILICREFWDQHKRQFLLNSVQWKVLNEFCIHFRFFRKLSYCRRRWFSLWLRSKVQATRW